MARGWGILQVVLSWGYLVAQGVMGKKLASNKRADMPQLADFFAGKSPQFVSNWFEENNLSEFIKPVFEKAAREER